MNSRTTVLALMGVVAIASCKGDPQVKDSPETLKRLQECEDSLKKAGGPDKEARIAELEAKVLELEADNGDVIVTLTGDTMEITGGTGPNGRSNTPTGKVDDEKLYQAFLGGVQKSRPAITKCYQTALKKDSTLQARTIELLLQITYDTAGEVRYTQFAPPVSEGFKSCLTRVSKNWRLPPAPRSFTFRAPVRLTPQN